MAQRHTDDTGNTSDEPRLDIRAPLAAGLAAFVLYAGAAAGTATFAPVAAEVSLAGVVADSGDAALIAAPTGGTVASVHVGHGDWVAAGDILVSLDNMAIAQEVAALKTRLEAASQQLELARAEVATAADLVSRKAESADHLARMKTKATQAEAEAMDLDARLSAAQNALERGLVRALSSGRIKSLDVVAGQAVAPGLPLMTIAPEQRTLSADLCDRSGAAALVGKGSEARVRIFAGDPLAPRLATGRIAAATPRVGALDACPSVVRIEVETDGPAFGSFRPGTAISVGVTTGRRTLLEQIGLVWQSRKHA